MKTNIQSIINIHFLAFTMMLGTCYNDSLANAVNLARTLPYESDKPKIVVVIDPGHGGNDLGSITSTGINEKEITLAVAEEIKRQGAGTGIEFILTRDLDQNKTADERVALSKKFSAVLFVSIHVNFDSDSLRSGIDLAFSGQNTFVSNSKELAQQLLNELQQLSGVKANSLKEADFYILTRNPVPAVTLDLGYMSNKSDLDFIQDPRNQAAVSKKIISAIVKYSK